jgi:hypothetical protein
MIEFEFQALPTREKTARLKELQLDDRFHEIDHGTSGLFAVSSFAIG